MGSNLYTGGIFVDGSLKNTPLHRLFCYLFRPLHRRNEVENSTSTQPDGHGYELVSSVRALVPQKFSIEEELMHVKHVEVKSPHVGVMWKFGRGVISSGPPAVLTGEGIKLPCVFEAVREIYRNILATASFEKVDHFRSEIQLAGHPLRGLNKSCNSRFCFSSSFVLERSISTFSISTVLTTLLICESGIAKDFRSKSKMIFDQPIKSIPRIHGYSKSANTWNNQGFSKSRIRIFNSTTPIFRHLAPCAVIT
ncbi:hypothetical protein TNCV_540711 [Trichonephila clavipes]|nr:hypothetical protein TNCV_540711 [Trichonephila clavipes]